jgi:hypothetical protein
MEVKMFKNKFMKLVALDLPPITIPVVMLVLPAL